MLFIKKLNTSLLVLVLSTFMLSCKTNISIDGDGKVDIPIVNTNIDTVPDSIKGLLVLHENFQQWKRDGYYLQTKQDCETDVMKSTRTVSYFPTNVSVIYDALQVNYSLIDFAVNPECGNPDGTSTATSEVSTGYVALQCPIWYTCGHYSKGYFITSPIPSVSYLEFTISYSYNSGNTYATGISLWKKGDNDADTIKVGTFVPSNPLEGEKFTVKINSKNVILKFKAERNSTLPIANESDINRAVRIHDLYILKPNK